MRGHLYAAQFSSGIVKVGRATDPDKRLAEHRSRGAAFGLTMVRYWTSYELDNIKIRELHLLDWCKERSTACSPNEWFSGIYFDDLVEHACSLIVAPAISDGPMTKDQVLAYFGGATKTADALGISQPSVSGWGERPPILRQLAIEAITDGALKAGRECEPFRTAVARPASSARKPAAPAPQRRAARTA